MVLGLAREQQRDAPAKIDGMRLALALAVIRRCAIYIYIHIYTERDIDLYQDIYQNQDQYHLIYQYIIHVYLYQAPLWFLFKKNGEGFPQNMGF